MLIGPSGNQYLPVAFNNEEELERVVLNNSEMLFGGLSVVLPKKKISTIDGAGTIPDGVVIDLQRKTWLILEAELAHHGTWTHIAPQVGKQVTALANPESKEIILREALAQISGNKDILDRLEEDLGITQVKLHTHLQQILQLDPEVAIPIDEVPKDLTDWAATLKYKVKIWAIEKFINASSGEILYSVPDDALSPNEITLDVTRQITVVSSNLTSDLYQDLFAKGILSDGQRLYMKYGPKSGTKTPFTGIARINGVEIEGNVYSPSTAALICIRKINPNRQSVNGWTAWKNETGETLDQLAGKLAK